MLIKAKKSCDMLKCFKVNRVVSVTIFEQGGKHWGTIHLCVEHRKELKTLIQDLLKPLRKMK